MSHRVLRKKSPTSKPVRRSPSSFIEHDWYHLPRYYDMVFDTETVREADFLEILQERHSLNPGERVLEPACGSGRLVRELARRHYRVTGLDINREMLRYARGRLRRARLPAHLIQADMARFAFGGTFHLAHCLVSTFKYLLTEKDAHAHLCSVRDALVEGGIYVVGFHLSDYDTSAKVRERWVVRRGRTHVVCNIQTWPPRRAERLEHVRSRLVVDGDGPTRCYETNWEFRTYDAVQVRRLLARLHGLKLVAAYDFTYSLDSERELVDDPLDCVLVLRKGRVSRT